LLGTGLASNVNNNVNTLILVAGTWLARRILLILGNRSLVLGLKCLVLWRRVIRGLLRGVLLRGVLLGVVLLGVVLVLVLVLLRW